MMNLSFDKFAGSKKLQLIELLRLMIVILHHFVKSQHMVMLTKNRPYFGRIIFHSIIMMSIIYNSLIDVRPSQAIFVWTMLLVTCNQGS